ncbi:MAG TPA: tetratricopeptide repeat protein [Bryobacteraceae bacterium]|jgi:tetratricopeptide (TPR) repeat protein
MFRFGLLLALAIAPAILAQTTPPKGGTPPTSPGTTTTTPPAISRPSASPGLNRGTIFISGRVMLEDGTAPTDPVVIEKICGSSRRAEAHTDNKGEFSFQLGMGAVNTEALSDMSAETSRLPGTGPTFGSAQQSAGAPGNAPTRLGDSSNLMGCELHAVLAGFWSRNVTLAANSGLDSTDVGVIILKRLAPGNEGSTVSMTNALAPKDAKKAYDKAKQLIAKGKSTDARASLTKAVEIYPKYASAWFELGVIQMEVDEPAAARASFAKSLEADPNYLPPYERIAVLELRDKHWRELATTTGRLIQLNAYEFPQAYFYNALAHLNLIEPELAEKSAREALKQDPQKFSRATYVLGLALAQRGDFAGGAEQLKAYLLTKPPDSELPQLRQQLADMQRRAAGTNRD